MPVLIMYRFGIYFTSFLIGYYILSHDQVQVSVEKIRIPMLFLFIAGAAAYTVYYYGSNYCAPACLQSAFTAVYLWTAILAILGWGRAFFNEETLFTNYMSRSGFGLFIIHYPVLLIICYILHSDCNFAPIWNYAIAAIGGFAVTFALYEMLKRIPLIRYLVLGIKA